MPTREDVLAIRSLEEAFDLWTPRVTKREVALIRVASVWSLVELTEHAAIEADDEMIPHSAVWGVIERARAKTKDLGQTGDRAVGVNFEGTIPDHRRIRTKVSWDDGYFIATVHTINMVR